MIHKYDVITFCAKLSSILSCRACPCRASGVLVPKELLPESFEDLTFEEFFELYGQADCAREMRIEDIETGVAKGIADNFSNDE